MKYRMLALLSAMAVLLSGCQFLIKNDYHASSKHSLQAEETQPQEEIVYFTAHDYGSMKTAIIDAVDSLASRAVLTLDTRTYDGDYLDDYQQVREEVLYKLPKSAYLLESISAHSGGIAPHCELNLLLCYRRTEADWENAISVQGNENEIDQMIYSALESYADHLLLYFADGEAAVAQFTQAKLNQKAQEYYRSHMTGMMSLPYIERRIYPETGKERLFELKITYPHMNGLDIKTMQSSVSAIMEAAQTYVQDYETDQEKAMMLYSFLAARLVTVHETTSTTPAYDMLICGVADSCAFSAVYQAMCERVEVPCRQVRGHKDGKDYTWNILELSTGTWHVDPLWDAQNGYRLQLLTDAQMSGYEWDHKDYPACPGATEPPPETQAAGEDRSPQDEGAQPPQEPDEPTPPDDPPPSEPPSEEPPADPQNEQ